MPVGPDVSKYITRGHMLAMLTQLGATRFDDKALFHENQVCQRTGDSE